MTKFNILRQQNKNEEAFKELEEYNKSTRLRRYCQSWETMNGHVQRLDSIGLL